LYHYHSLDFVAWGARLRRRLGRPVIFDCREDYDGYVRQRRGIPNVLRPLLSRVVRRQLRLAASYCDAIIVADQGTAKLFSPRARPAVVLHNFPRLDLFPKTELPRDRRYDLVYHGTLPKYHLEACLAIDDALMKRGYHLQWRLIGLIPEADWLTVELVRRGVRDRFSISGLVPHEQIAHEVIQAKIGIIPLPRLPKFEHNIPQKLFEFMALQLPVVLSDLPPSRPFVGDGGCALSVPPDDYRAYADAIIRLIEDPGLRQRMGAEGRKRVEQVNNWEHESRKLVDLYRELLGA
jgi:glycosyltransferase involved in cell wall biosynthesis